MSCCIKRRFGRCSSLYHYMRDMHRVVGNESYAVCHKSGNGFPVFGRGEAQVFFKSSAEYTFV